MRQLPGHALAALRAAALLAYSHSLMLDARRISVVRALAWTAVAIAILAVTGWTNGRRPAPSASVTLMRVPVGGLQPQVAVDRSGAVHLIYFTGEPAHGDIFYARGDGGPGFSAPVRVNTHSGSAIAVGNVRGAQLAVGRNGRVHVAWLGSDRAEPRATGGATPMLYARSNPGDGTFQPERNLIQFATGLDGGGSLAADGAGNVYVAWHAGGPNAKGEADRRVWVARSTDDGQTFPAETPAFDPGTGACGCCGMRAFADRRGGIYMLYRSATEMVHRDTYLLASEDHGATFAGTKLQEWNIGACPMSTFAMAEGPGSVLAAWETAGRVYWSRIERGSARITTPIAAPGAETNQKHPAIAGNDRGQTILVWTEGMAWSRGGSVVWQVYDEDGTPMADRGRSDGVPAWSLVAAYVRRDGGFIILY